jgi:hypothetical protein
MDKRYQVANFNPPPLTTQSIRFFCGRFLLQTVKETTKHPRPPLKRDQATCIADNTGILKELRPSQIIRTGKAKSVQV